MFKIREENLDQPVTLRDFKEFADFVVENVVMKSDLDGFAKKSDLDVFAKKSDLDVFAKKSDLDECFSRQTSEIMNHIDKVMGVMTTIRQEQIMEVARDDRQDAEIVVIQKRLGLAPLAF